jgi:hypothetical protein
MKMGRRLSRGRGIGYVSVQICALLVRQPPDRWPIFIATKAMLSMGQDTNPPDLTKRKSYLCPSPRIDSRWSDPAQRAVTVIPTSTLP